MGAFDYVMYATKNEAYMKNFTPEQLEYFDSFPALAVAFWATAVWSGLLGSFLLLFRKKHAVPVFLVSLIAMVLTTIHNYGLSNGMEVMGDTFSLVFTAVIFVITVALYVYARAMKQAHVLV